MKHLIMFLTFYFFCNFLNFISVIFIFYCILFISSLYCMLCTFNAFVANKLPHCVVFSSKLNRQVLFDVSFLTDIALHLSGDNKLLSASTATVLALHGFATLQCCMAISLSTQDRVNIHLQCSMINRLL